MDKASYLKALAEAEETLNEEMRKYEETPENHPAYQDEWKKFWCNRFKELQSEGKVNPHTYDYKPEWIDFWNVRMKELFKKELETRQSSLKLKFSIPDIEDKDDKEVISFFLKLVRKSVLFKRMLFRDDILKAYLFFLGD